MVGFWCCCSDSATTSQNTYYQAACLPSDLGNSQSVAGYWAKRTFGGAFVWQDVTQYIGINESGYNVAHVTMTGFTFHNLPSVPQGATITRAELRYVLPVTTTSLIDGFLLDVEPTGDLFTEYTTTGLGSNPAPRSNVFNEIPVPDQYSVEVKTTIKALNVDTHPQITGQEDLDYTTAADLRNIATTGGVNVAHSSVSSATSSDSFFHTTSYTENSVNYAKLADVKTLVQAVVNRTGWQAGNLIGFRYDDNGTDSQYVANDAGRQWGTVMGLDAGRSGPSFPGPDGPLLYVEFS